MSLLVMVQENTAIKSPKNSLYKSRAELLVTITAQALLGNLSISRNVWYIRVLMTQII